MPDLLSIRTGLKATVALAAHGFASVDAGAGMRALMPPSRRMIYKAARVGPYA